MSICSLPSEDIIYDDYVSVIADDFYHNRYGIKKCSRPICKALAKIRYDLLTWFKSDDEGSSSTDPIVDAGADQVIQLPVDTGTLTGYYSSGSHTIVSHLWTKASGPSITLDTPALLITDYIVTTAGTYNMKLTIVDSNNLSYSDTMKITVLNATRKAYYGFKPANIPVIESEILAADFVNITDPSNNYTLPLQVSTTDDYVWFAELLTEPIKTKWYVDSLNNGSIGGDENLFATPYTIGAYRVYMSNYQTQFSASALIKVV